MDGLVKFVGTLQSSPCFSGFISRDPVGFPVVTFTFANAVDLALDVKSSFYPAKPSSFCMAVVPSTAADLTLIGALAQQSYNITYDLVGNTVSIQRIDCALLE
nr:protein aspartic protease in guard cell 1 [Quercus suber]